MESKSERFSSWKRKRKGMMDESSKLFRLPGTIEEEEEEEQQKGTESHKAKELIDNAAESLLLGQKGSTLSALPRNVTLIRVSTQSSSIVGGIGRQDSTRWESDSDRFIYLNVFIVFCSYNEDISFKNIYKITHTYTHARVRVHTHTHTQIQIYYKLNSSKKNKRKKHYLQTKTTRKHVISRDLKWDLSKLPI